MRRPERARNEGSTGRKGLRTTHHFPLRVFHIQNSLLSLFVVQDVVDGGVCHGAYMNDGSLLLFVDAERSVVIFRVRPTPTFPFSSPLRVWSEAAIHTSKLLYYWMIARTTTSIRPTFQLDVRSYPPSKPSVRRERCEASL